MGTEILMRGRVSRALPQRDVDGGRDGEPVRIGLYGDTYVIPMVRKQHALVDEGVMFTTNNGQSGIASPTGTSFSATVGMLTLTNTDTPGNTAARRIYVDNIVLVTTAAGGWASAGVNTQIVVTIDQGERYSSGGTDLSNAIVNPNMDTPVRTSVARVRFGNLVLTSASGSVRTVCGLRILRPAVSATVADVVGEIKVLNFGGVEAAINGSITIANANMISVPLPAIVLGPNSTMNVHYIMNGTTPSAASFAPEVTWWER
jgi:hypothetical protein